MAKKTKEVKSERFTTENEQYLNRIFTMMRKQESLSIADKQTHFNSTEIRLLGEVLAAKYVGKRLISTQIAKLLGITRSAVSQIINRLESEGVVKRVPDEVDKKIAYIEITDSALETYSADLEVCVDFVGKIVEKFGVENFNTLCGLFDEFYTLIEREKDMVELPFILKNSER